MADPIKTQVYDFLQAIHDKRISTALVKVFEKVYPRVRTANITASLTLNDPTHEGKTCSVNAAAGCAITLPASTGGGARYRLFIGTTITSNTTTIKVANASDIMAGTALLGADGGNTVNLWETGASDDTITMDGSTRGGIKGDYIELEDVALNVWFVRFIGSATGAEATPFSATVS